MNILHISPDFNYSCGVSKHVFLLLEELKKVNNVNLFFITNIGDSLERISQLNINISYLKFDRGELNPFNFFKCVFQLWKYCKENKIDIIHTHHRYPELIACFVKLLLRIKTVTTVHSLTEGWKNFSFKSDHIIAVSKTVQNHLINNYNISELKIKQIYNFIKPVSLIETSEIKKLRNELGFTEKEIIILFVGRITFMKGINELIYAFEQISNNLFTIRLILVGDIIYNKIFNKIKNNRYIYHIKATNEVIKYYYLCNIVALPSWKEALGYVMLEAGQLKKPFIGGRTGGIEEFIEDGVDGLLVEPGNETDLYNKMKLLINDSDLCKTLANNLYIKVSKLNDSEDYIKKLIDIYNS